jgi:hypothetical protein
MVCSVHGPPARLALFILSNQARLAWNERTIQNIATTTATLSPLILPNEFSQFLVLAQKGHSYSMDQIMSYEMKRLHSFKCNFPVSAIRLSQSGFFATGVVDEVKCFLCAMSIDFVYFYDFFHWFDCVVFFFFILLIDMI